MGQERIKILSGQQSRYFIKADRNTKLAQLLFPSVLICWRWHPCVHDVNFIPFDEKMCQFTFNSYRTQDNHQGEIFIFEFCLCATENPHSHNVTQRLYEVNSRATFGALLVFDVLCTAGLQRHLMAAFASDSN